MPQSFFVFDFGTNEEAAQQARHKVESWKQGFRLGDKMQLKFDRGESGPQADAGGDAKPGPAKKQAGKKATEKNAGTAAPPAQVKLLLRLAFSDHEKLTHQRWLDRIPNEEPFKGAAPELIRSGDPEHSQVVELFDSLD